MPQFFEYHHILCINSKLIIQAIIFILVIIILISYHSRELPNKVYGPKILFHELLVNSILLSWWFVTHSYDDIWGFVRVLLENLVQ